MTDRVTVSKDKSRLLPPNSPEKGWRITTEQAAELGLLDASKPKQERRTADTEAAPEAPKQKRRYTKRK